MTFGAGGTSAGTATAATLAGDSSALTPLSGLDTVDGDGRYFPAWWEFTAPAGVTRVWFDVTGSNWTGDPAAVNSDAQLYDTDGVAADYWLTGTTHETVPLGLRYRLEADVTPGQTYRLVVQATDDTGSGVTAWVVQATGYVVSYDYGDWLAGEDYTTDVAMLSLARLERGKIINTPADYPTTGLANVATIRSASQAPGTDTHDDELDGQIEGFYGGDLESVVHVLIDFQVEPFDGSSINVYAEWRRVPRAFRHPVPPAFSPPPLPEGAISVETTGDYAITNATLEAHLDHYNGGHFSSAETAVPSEDVPPDGGEWSEGIFVDNDHAVWASPTAFDHYEPDVTGPSGTLIGAYSNQATVHGATTTEWVDVTSHLDDNGNILLFSSPVGVSAPAVTPTYRAGAGLTQHYQQWWGGDISQPYSRLHYTFSAPSYRYLYEVLTPYGSTLCLRKYPTASLRKWPPEQFQGTSLRKIGSYP